jgi:hypothetical protein
MTTAIEKIKEIAGKTWFELCDEGDHFALESRQYGDVCNEETGLEDRKEGNRLRKALQDAGIKSSIEAVDEWVVISIVK